MELKTYIIDVFTDRPFEGNPAGVVLDEGQLNTSLMQKIASELNASETAFIKSIDSHTYDIKFFTPSCEVDFCGHATIAAVYALVAEEKIDIIENGKISVMQNTNVGTLLVDIYFKDGGIQKTMMQQEKPKSYGTDLKLVAICELMNIETEMIGLKNLDLKPEIISTGLKDLIIPVRNKNILSKLKVDFAKLKEYSREKDIVGIHVFTADNSKNINEAYCRNFAPVVGINEEAATGTSNGALTYYLYKNGLLEDNKLLVRQGECMNRPSQIFCEISDSNNGYEVYVGGKAKIVFKGSMFIMNQPELPAAALKLNSTPIKANSGS
ncbi:MAG: PhzF family phenazine biosynthesis protein [Clostridiales bacterium]|nr:PhzF family phenazine biosynthesis protein [Clostridiales bacterium]